MIKEANLACTAMVGQFSGEFAVKIETIYGSCSFFAPEELLVMQAAPFGDQLVKATLRVTIIGSMDKKSMIYLPRESFEMGRYITVEDNLLTYESVPEPA